jgi:hypothetical protein
VAYNLAHAAAQPRLFCSCKLSLSRSRLDLIQLYARAPSKVILIVNGLGYPPLRSPWLRRGFPLCCDTQELRDVFIVTAWVFVVVRLLSLYISQDIHLAMGTVPIMRTPAAGVILFIHVMSSYSTATFPIKFIP